jgi:SAM-dependent methyltransferase
VDMYDDGYSHLTAMDYAPEGIERCREMLGEGRTRNDSNDSGVDLVVADARDLSDVFDDHVFDAVIEKGTLDAIFLSGGQDKDQAMVNLNMAISELGRCVKPGGIWMSVAAVVDDQIQASFDARHDWECLVEKGTLFITEDGFTSNNIDGTLLVWRKRLCSPKYHKVSLSNAFRIGFLLLTVGPYDGPKSTVSRKENRSHDNRDWQEYGCRIESRTSCAAALPNLGSSLDDRI